MSCAGCPEPQILPENQVAISLFLACQTQWRCGMNGRTGLDYSGVESAARLMETPDLPDTFARLRILEAEVLRVDRERPPAN